MNNNIRKVSVQTIVDLAQANLQSLLTEFTYSQDFLADINTAFGGDFNRLSLEQFYQQWQENNFDDFPIIEIISSTEFDGANGAFSVNTNKIYLAKEFLTANRLNINAVTAVLLEEYGHYIDSQINSFDSPGDEGAIFSVLVRDKKFKDLELQQLKKEDDSTVVTIDGENIAIEQNIQISQLTNNNVIDSYPLISGNNVVWQQDDGNYDWEIYLYDGSTTTQLTDNDFRNYSPSISGNNVVWVQNDGNIENIMFSVVPEKFKFTDLVIEGTEGETKQIGVTRISEDLSTTEYVDIEVLPISEMEKEISSILSDLVTFTNGTGGVSESNRKFDLLLKKVADRTVDRIGCIGRSS